jgi:hypothetical protein
VNGTKLVNVSIFIFLFIERFPHQGRSKGGGQVGPAHPRILLAHPRIKVKHIKNKIHLQYLSIICLWFKIWPTLAKNHCYALVPHVFVFPTTPNRAIEMLGSQLDWRPTGTGSTGTRYLTIVYFFLVGGCARHLQNPATKYNLPIGSWNRVTNRQVAFRCRIL